MKAKSLPRSFPARFLGVGLSLTVLVSQAHAQSSSNERVLYRFNGTSSAHPNGGLARDDAGNLYGTAGLFAFGIIYRFSPNDGVATTLYSFSGGTDGSAPFGTILRDGAGNLYGTTSRGGTVNDSCPSGCGTVYKLAPDGKFTVLYSFTGGADGGTPLAGLISDPQGNLYGTTCSGGASTTLCPDGCGVVFKVSARGEESVLYQFLGLEAGDGSFPESGLTRDSAGNLYGTTYNGGLASCNCGVVFKLAPDGTETVLLSFDGTNGNQPDPESLALDSDGNLYGATQSGGANDMGVAYRIAPAGEQTILHTFTGGSDGGDPYGGLIRDRAGNLYGTTLCVNCSSGLPGTGLVFQLSPAGTETVLYTFQGGDDAAISYTGVLRGRNGSLYGTTYFGGSSYCQSGCGTIYEVKR